MRFDPEQMFDRLDTNKDGTITKQEFDEGMSQFRRGGDRSNQEGRGAPGEPGARFREAMLDRLKEQLGSDDKEWTVLKPRVEKVMELQRDLRGGPMAFRGQTGESPESEALRTAIENKDTKPEVLKEKTEALRAAKKKQAAELDAARAQLREVVTARQEAVLVLAGLLD